MAPRPARFRHRNSHCRGRLAGVSFCHDRVRPHREATARVPPGVRIAHAMEEIAMTVSPTLQKYLDQSVTYDLIPHAPTMSSTRTAEACHVPGEALAKAVVLRRDGGYMMAVLPASHHLHLSALKSQLGHTVDLASEDEIAAAVRGLRPRGRTAARRMLRAGRHHRRQHRCAAARLHGKRRSRHADPHGRARSSRD